MPSPDQYLYLDSSTESALRDAICRDEWAADPGKWTQDRLQLHLWSKQRDILQSLRTNRRTIVHSCHSAGKSLTCAVATTWWLDTHKPGDAFVVTTAPTESQVRAVLWREINRAHARGKLLGRVNQTEWWAIGTTGAEEMVAIGRKPRDTDIAAFQGIHQRYILVIIDEGCGVDRNIWTAANSLISNRNGRILAVDNPDDPTSYAAEVSKPGSGWQVHHISAFDTPNFTGESIPEDLRDLLISPIYVEESRKEWGEDSPLYISKVLGQFPPISTDGLIPLSWIRDAQNSDLPSEGDIEIGLDVGGGGSGKSVTAIRHGSHIRILRRSREPNTMVTLGQLLVDIRETRATIARVDYIGIGKGIVDRAEEIANDQSVSRDERNIAARVIGVNVGIPANDSKSYVNARAEGYWHLRKRFESGEIDLDPKEDTVAAQLSAIKYKYIAGRVQIESKEDMRRRGMPSPDEADAVMLSTMTGGGKKKKRATWGSRKRDRQRPQEVGTGDDN